MYGSIDSRTIQDASIPGLSFRVSVHPDYDSKPTDAECYTPSQIKAWETDDWSYVGCIVVPVIGGLDLDICQESLWGLEWGYFLMTDEQDNETGRTWIDLDAFISGKGDDYEAYPVPDLIEECKAGLVKTLGPKIDALRAAQAALEQQGN